MAKKKKQKREPTIEEAYAKFVREARKVWLYPSKTFNLELDGSVHLDHLRLEAGRRARRGRGPARDRPVPQGQA